MTRLSVNINKVALLRNARRGNYPDLYRFATDCELFGAQGITVHPRPDERHIRYADVPVLKNIVTTELNIEGFPDERFMNLVLVTKPDQCTLVPDGPHVLTSEEGWDIERHGSFLEKVCLQLQKAGIRSSVFINPDPTQVPYAKAIGADAIEIYTGGYATDFKSSPKESITSHREVYLAALSHGLLVNAGHDLNLDNLGFYKANLPDLHEVSIGHAIIADALYYGISNVIQMYLSKLQSGS